VYLQYASTILAIKTMEGCKMQLFKITFVKDSSENFTDYVFERGSKSFVKIFITVELQSITCTASKSLAENKCCEMPRRNHHLTTSEYSSKFFINKGMD